MNQRIKTLSFVIRVYCNYRPLKPLWLIFRVLGQSNTKQTMFYTLPLFTSAFSSWPTGAFDLKMALMKYQVCSFL